MSRDPEGADPPAPYEIRIRGQSNGNVLTLDNVTRHGLELLAYRLLLLGEAPGSHVVAHTTVTLPLSKTGLVAETAGSVGAGGSRDTRRHLPAGGGVARDEPVRARLPDSTVVGYGHRLRA